MRRARDGRAVSPMVEMLGLRTPLVRLSLVAVICSYVAAGLILDPLEVGPLRQTAGIGGSVLLAVALVAAASGGEDPLRRRAVAAAAVLGPVGIALVWWHIPVGPAAWVRPTAPLTVYAVVVIVLILRGRVRAAWAAFGAMSVVGFIAWAAWGWEPAVAVPPVLKLLVAAVPATLMMMFARPLLQFVHVLDQRELQAAAQDAALAATLDQRRCRAAEFDAEVRPFLERVAGGERFDAVSVERARLLEHRLRDTVRGRGWREPRVDSAVAEARARGVTVHLFDDRVRAHDAGCDANGVVHDELVARLAETDAGTVTARILPEGRGSVATVTVSAGDRVRRRVCRTFGDGGLSWRDDSGGAPGSGAPPERSEDADGGRGAGRPGR